MSSRKHLAKLKKGVEVWNTWRGKNLAVQPDFSRANLSERDLSTINLSGANLFGADLSGADLTGANLRRAILNGADLNGADLRGAKLRGAKLRGADLTDADLTQANLTGADLRGAILRGANLLNADLSERDLSAINLVGAKLRGADLIGADLTEANLTQADLTEADLTEADLHGADLTGANLTGANLRGANLEGAKLFRTVIDEITKEGLEGNKLLFDEKNDLEGHHFFASSEEGRSIASGATLTISIADNEIPLLLQERILNAAGRLMEAMGYELEAEEEPKYGSFFQRIRYKLGEWITPEDRSKLAEEAKEALHTQINKTAIETTATLAAATAELIASLKEVDNAAIRLETIIVVKTTIEGVSTVRVENVSMALGHKLRDEPAFMENPVAVARFLDEQKRAQIAEPATPLRPPSPPTEKIAEVDEEDPPKVQT